MNLAGLTSVTVTEDILVLVGLANSKTIGVQQGEEGGIAVTVTHAKNSGKPAKRAHTTTSKKSFQRNAASLGKIAAGARPDLKVRLAC